MVIGKLNEIFTDLRDRKTVRDEETDKESTFWMFNIQHAD